MRRIVALGLLVALSGCSDLSGLMSFDSKPDEEPVVAQASQPAAMPAPAPDDSFCKNVAMQDATGHGFDEATQKKVAVQSYAQCQALFGQR